MTLGRKTAREPLPDAGTDRVERIIASQAGGSGRKQAEDDRAQLAAIVETSDDAIVSHDPDGAVLSWNAAAEKILGYTAAEMIGRNISVLAPPERTHEAQHSAWLLQHGKPVPSFESVRLTKDGSLVEVQVSTSAVRDAAGNVVRIAAILRDVTERKETEAARARLAAIVENSNDAIFTRSLDGTILSWNAGAEKMLGYTAAEAIGKPISFTLPPGRTPNLARNNEKVLRGETVVPHESNRMTRDGRVIDVLTSHSPLRDKAGNIVGASIILQDITALKRAEAGARQSEEWFRAAFEQAGVGMGLRGVDPRNPRWLRVNQKLCDILGYTREELLQLTSVDITPPEERDVAIDYNEKLLSGEIATFSRAKRYTCKDGRIILANITLTPVRGLNGRPSHFISVVEDITARMEAEKHFRLSAAVFETTQEGIMVTDASNRIILVNPAFTRITGRTPDEVIGESPRLLSSGMQDEAFYKTMWASINDTGLWQGEIWDRRKNGETYCEWLSISTVKNAQGEILYHAAIFSDITKHKQAEGSHAQLAAIVESSQDAIIGRTLEGTITSWNAGAERIFGYARAEALGRHITMLIPPERREAFEANQKPLGDGRERPPFESIQLAKDGRRIPVSVSISSIRDARGRVTGVSIIVHDITARKHTEAERAQLAAIVENSGDAIISRCLDRKILTWNAAAERMFGYAAAEVIGQNVSLIIPPDREEEATHTRAQLDRGRAVLDFETERLAKDGRRIPVSLSQSPIRDEHGTMVGVSIIFRDIAERKQAAERIEFLAQYDALTGLPNRRLLTDRLTLAMARDKRLGAMTALLLLDLDRFKQINESLGHGVGDELLKAVTLRLRELLREVDTIARLGGDEFMVILESVTETEQALRVAGKIVEAMEEAFVIGGEEIFITASVGVALYPDHADSLEKLIENAELAMYEAKREGRNTLRLYAPEQNSRRAGGFSMENKLRRALERDEFVLNFQPKVNIKTGAITGAEALIRWRNPELGLVSPAEFIPLAEETGLIVPIGEWVLHSACAQAAAWHRQGHPLSIAVNLSARQFHQKNLCEMVRQTLADSGLDAEYLELEITESMVMRRPEQTIAMLQQLHDIGLKLSVDDFGTGYSSLSYLKRFPVHKLKVDQSFVRDLNENADDAAIVRTVIALARNLNLKTVAEGVETEQQLIFLAGLDCDEYQGYYFSKPVPAEEFLALLQSRQPAAATAEPSQLSAATVNRIAAALRAPQ